jgi:hypothetical protein
MGKMTHVDVDDLLTSIGLRPTARAAGVPLFDLPSSEMLLKLCERLGVGILGIEGFTLVNGRRRPEMEYIADFSQLLSSDDFVVESLKCSRQFLQLATEGQRLLFEYVLTKFDSSGGAPMGASEPSGPE